MNLAYTKEKFLDLMDEINAFDIKVSGLAGGVTPDNYVVISFSDGLMFFHRDHWELVIEIWDLDGVESVYMNEVNNPTPSY